MHKCHKTAQDFLFFFFLNTLFLLALTFLLFALRFAVNSLCQTKVVRYFCFYGWFVPGNQGWKLCPQPQRWDSGHSQSGEHLVFWDLLLEEMGEAMNASWCHGQGGSRKWKSRSSCDVTFSSPLSCSFPSCMGKIVIFSLHYKLLRGL